MEEEAVKLEIKQFIEKKILKNQKSISSTDSLLESGIIDSMGMMTMINHFEDQYKIKIQDEELMPENFDSVEKIQQFLLNKI